MQTQYVEGIGGAWAYDALGTVVDRTTGYELQVTAVEPPVGMANGGLWYRVDVFAPEGGAALESIVTSVLKTDGTGKAYKKSLSDPSLRETSPPVPDSRRPGVRQG